MRYLAVDVTIEADIEEEPDARNLPVRDFAGTVSRLENLTPTIKGVWIKLKPGQTVEFQAGQYINLVVPGEAQNRAFSIASIPTSSDEIELNIRRVPGGRATGWVHEELKLGDAVRFSGPYGRFLCASTQHVADKLPYLFLAGGSGLSSPRSMVLDLLSKACDLPIVLVYGARSQAELYHHDEFLALAAKHANFEYLPVLSHEPADSAWAGAKGMVHEAAKAYFNNDFRGRKAYLCGPPLMIDACINTLMQGRLFERDIYTEKIHLCGGRPTSAQPLVSQL